MLLIVSDNTDIYHHLAAEDYILHQMDEDVMMLWRSRNAVVCGKHQNLCSEVNYGYCRENEIGIARRLTGGGTVFHDEGNINFTFIQTIARGLEYAVDYRRFLEPVRLALLNLGIPADYSSRNDLLLHGRKISGNAEHVLQKKKRVLHHGTLLFKSNLQKLGKALRSDGVYEDRAVKSVRSEVCNITDYYLKSETAGHFMQQLADYFAEEKHTNRYVFNAADIVQIDMLRQQKYQTHEWIVGYSPAYSVTKTLATPYSEPVKLKAHCHHGIIENLVLEGTIQPVAGFDAAEFDGMRLTEALSAKLSQQLQKAGISADPYILF